MATKKEAADLVTIQHISILLDQLEKTSLKQQKKQQQRMSSKCFIEFFKRFTNDGLTMEDSFTPFTLEVMMRLLCPCLDTSRKYGLKEYMLSDLISSYPYLSVEAGKIIKHWNGSNMSRDDSNIFFIEKTTGNLGSIVEEAFRASFGSSSSQTGQRYPTLRIMAQLLDELASLSSFTTEPITKSKRSRDSIIADLYGNQDPSVCKWITRILLKNLLPVKLDPYQVLGSFHPCLRRIYFMTSCLRETSVRLADLFKDRQFHNENMFYGDDQDLNLNIYKKALEHCCKPNLGTRISSMESIQCKVIASIIFFFFMNLIAIYCPSSLSLMPITAFFMNGENRRDFYANSSMTESECRFISTLTGFRQPRVTVFESIQNLGEIRHQTERKLI